MKRRKLNEEELNIIIEGLKDADYVLLESSKGATFFGSTPELLGAYAELTNHLLEKAEIPKEFILDACKLGLDMESMYDKKDDKELDKDLDKKLETIEKLVDILKDLRKGDK